MKRNFFPRFTSFAALLLLPISLLAQNSPVTEMLDHNKPENPFSSDLLRDDYIKTVNNLRPGDLVSYDAKVFQLGEYLGGDSATRIFAISDSKAIRIGKSPIHFSKSYAAAYPTLSSAGRSVVQVFLEESRPDYNFLIVERLNHKFSLSDFVARFEPIKYATKNSPSFTRNPERIIAAREEDESKVRQGLEDFVKNMAMFSSIGDYHNDQVIWDGSRFVLIDWAGHVENFKSLNDKSDVMAHLAGRSAVTAEDAKRLRELLTQERKRLRQPGRRCQNLFAP
ncbi:hypothetical protein BH10BDE1_BH10BDE1_23270 [soil metagenome]